MGRKSVLEKSVFALLAAAIVAASAVTALAVAPGKTEEVSGGYTVDGKKYDLIRGAFLFPSEVAIDGAMKDIPAVFFYSDGFFAGEPDTYNNHLATASLCMAMAGFYSNEGETGPDADYSNKNWNIRQYMKDIGVKSDDIYVNHFNTIRPQTDSIGVTIGKKALTELSDGRILIPIAIRGSNYEREWTSNVTLGTEQNNEGEAQGFSSAAQIVFSEVERYIELDNDLSSAIKNGKVVFWIAGYSRAGATTNLTAKRLVDAYAAYRNKVFAYCVEAPMGGWKAAEKSGSNYNCIHSVINRNDIVPRVAPGFMSFKRYGVDHYLPGSDAGSIVEGSDGNKHDNEFYKTDTAPYIPVYQKMVEHLALVNNQFAFDDDFTVWGLDLRWLRTNLIFREGEEMYMDDFLDEFVGNLCAWTGMTREHYNEKGARDLDMGYLLDGNIQGALRDCMSIIYGSRTEETKAFVEALKSFWNDAGVNKWKELIGLLVYPLRKWNVPQWPYKEFYIRKAIRWLEDSNCFAPLNLGDSMEDKLLRTDMPILMQFLLTYAASDYQSELHGTSGLSQILTFLSNARNIGMNHYAEVTLAWLRAQDSLYDNEKETPSVSVARVALAEGSPAKGPMATVAAGASGKVIVGFGEIPDIFVKYGANWADAPTTTTVYYSDGTKTDAEIDWSNDDVRFYVHKDPNDDSSEWVEVDARTTTVEALMWLATGKVTLPADAKRAEGVDNTVTCCVYEAGLPNLPTPSASLEIGEYDGPQTITLSLDVTDGTEREIYYCVSTSSADMEPNQKYTGPITLDTDVTSKDYILLAYAKGDGETWDDSDIAIWEYTLSPADAPTSNKSGGGCDAGFAGLALLALAGLMAIKSKR